MNNNRLVVALLAVLAVIAIGVVLDTAKAVILPLVIAWMLSYILGPLVDYMTRRKIHPAVAIFLVLLLIVVLFAGIVLFVNARLTSMVAVFPKYHMHMRGILQKILAESPLPFNPLEKIDWGQKLYTYLVQMSGSLLFFIAKLVMVVVFLIFMLLGRPYLKYKIHKALSRENADAATHVLKSISDDIGRYLAVQVFISLLTGVLVWFSLALLRIDFAITWGALALILNFIPTIGSIAASVPPILMALIQYYPNYWMAVACVAVLLCIHMGIGYGLVPKLMGDRLNLSPVAVLLSLVFWGWLWGFVGALLAIPIASAIKIVCENIEPLHPIGILMGSGKPLAKEYKPDGKTVGA